MLPSGGVCTWTAEAVVPTRLHSTSRRRLVPAMCHRRRSKSTASTAAAGVGVCTSKVEP